MEDCDTTGSEGVNGNEVSERWEDSEDCDALSCAVDLGRRRFLNDRDMLAGFLVRHSSIWLREKKKIDTQLL